MDELRSALFSFLDNELTAVAAAEDGKIIYANPAAARLAPDILGADATALFGPELATPGSVAESSWNGMHTRGSDLGTLRLITISSDIPPVGEERSFVDAVVSAIHESLGASLYRLSDMARRARNAGDLASIRDLAATDRSICQVLRVARNMGRLYGDEDSQPKPALLELGDLVRDILSSVSYFSKDRDVKLEFSCDKPVELWGDRRLLEIMVMELVSNAIKHSAAGGTVTVTVGVSGGSAVIRIADSGVGGGKERLDAMQNRFGIPASALDPDAGAGLGLRVARRMAALHGGAVITQTLSDGAGTVVTAAIPLRDTGGGILSEPAEIGCTAFDILIEISDIADETVYEFRDVL